MNTVFQSYALFPHLSLFDNVAFGLRRKGVEKQQVKGRVEQMLRLVGLEGMGSRRPRQLSGGQQQRVALARALAQPDTDYEDVGGVGGTLAGNALSLAAVRATLGEVLTDEAFARMTALGEHLADGVAGAISAAGLPWHVARVGARAEYRFTPTPPRNGGESAAAGDEALERFLHLHALNRGVLITPFHNMALVSPATTAADVDRHTQVFTAALEKLA